MNALQIFGLSIAVLLGSVGLGLLMGAWFRSCDENSRRDPLQQLQRKQREFGK